MRNYPSDEYDIKEAGRLHAAPWQLEALKMNPEYCLWGIHEDYMMTKGDGWNSAQTFATWGEFGPWRLDDLNECVNFYFFVERDSEKCSACGQSGYNPETRRISDDFYDFDGTGRKWNAAITGDELAALVEHGRIRPSDGHPTLAEVNAANLRGGMFELHQYGTVNHDAINRGILIEARAKRLGVYGMCPACDGHGYVYTAPAARLGVMLWWLHPRKGCSRGVEVRKVAEAELSVVVSFLRQAAQRNADRFLRVEVTRG